MGRLRSIPHVLLAAALAGCAANDVVSVTSAHDPLARFPAQATFSWDDAASSQPEDPAIDRDELDGLLKEAATEAFAARGYRAAPPPAPYQLSYHYVVNTRISAEKSKSVGSLSLQLAESASGRRVWVGFGRAEVFVGLTPEERKARLRGAFDRMLEDFPPAQRPAD
jgi:hypothetical protein